MSRIFWDTHLFVYLLEGSGDRSTRVQALRTRMIERGDELLTSTLTLGELLVKPLEEGQEALAHRYEQLLSRGAFVVSFDQTAARIYATVRRDRTVKPPDAIQLACAASAGTDLFITNDERLSKKQVPGIDFVTSLDRAFL